MGKKQKKPEANREELLIIRHAHRDKKLGRLLDNGLSEKGIVQAKRIRRYLKKEFGGKTLTVFSSPKRRCIETVEGIAAKAGTEVVITSLLDEGGDVWEKVKCFAAEVRKKKKSDVLVCCSHGDIIPELLMELTDERIELDKGGIVSLKRNGEKFEVRELFQELN